MESLLLSSGSSACKDLIVPSRLGLFSPVPWKSYNQILVTFRGGFPWDSQSLCQINTAGDSKPSQQGGRTSSVLFSPGLSLLHRCGIDFPLTASLLLSHWLLLFFGHWGILAVNGCSTAGCNCGALIGGNEHMSFCSGVLGRKPLILLLSLYFTFFEYHIVGTTQSVSFSA